MRIFKSHGGLNREILLHLIFQFLKQIWYKQNEIYWNTLYCFKTKVYTLILCVYIYLYILSHGLWWLRPQSICLQCGRHWFDPWVRKILWRRKCQPTPVLLPGKSRGWRSVVGYSPWGCKESDTTERLHFHFLFTKCLIVARYSYNYFRSGVFNLGCKFESYEELQNSR